MKTLVQTIDWPITISIQATYIHVIAQDENLAMFYTD